MSKITKRQKEVLRELKSLIVINGFSPTVGELAAGLAISANAAQGHIKILEKKGYITKREKVSRTIKITEEGEEELMKFTHR